MLEQIRNYVNDNEFRFTMYENKIHIINYKRIVSLEDTNISFHTSKTKISIYGKNLKLKKLIKEEMLVTGIITKIEVHHE